MDKSTEHPVAGRRHSLRVLCMLMLVLMHFDIYGCSVMSMLNLPVCSVAVVPSAADKEAEDASWENNYENWENSDYRRRALRHTHLCRPVFFLRTVLFGRQDASCIQTHESPLQRICLYADADVCLLHCLLII